MSSSVFIESSAQSADNNDHINTSDSNLVVVYGKNGISFDDKGLENLIEDKKISSISVVRLTSPTPSMQDEEDEAAKLEEMFRRQEIGSDYDSGDSEGEDKNSLSEDTENCNSSNNDESDDIKGAKESDNESSEEGKSSHRRQLRRRGRQSIAVKQKKISRKHRRERPEIVGLRLEEFYPPEDANEIIKEALKMAGLKPDKKSRSEYEFQLYVIKNDHCYTPFTSPEQMKAKLAADKLEAESHALSRKSSALQQTVGKQLFVRKKIQQNVHSKSDTFVKLNLPTSILAKDKNIIVAHKIKKDIKDRKTFSETFVKDDDDLRSSFDENDDEQGGEDPSDLSSSDYSAETDNDRDSDLDFVVNNPKGRKRKAKLLKSHKRSVSSSKSNPKWKKNQDEIIELPNKSNIASSVATCSSSNVMQRQKTFIKIISDPSRITIRSAPAKIAHMIGHPNVLSPAIAALPPIPKKQTENKSLLKITSTSTPVTLPSKTYVLVKRPLEYKSSTLSSTQTHKEIVINKEIMSSPKSKGFTDLTKLIEQTEKQAPLKAVGPPVTTKSYSATVTSVVTFSPTSSVGIPLKGFMPLETAAKNHLPTQISIQSHQSSSELEAEHDKQLDLINSIVQNEMQKLNEKTDEQIRNNDENIPKLVKMLESTEKVLVSAKAQHSNIIPKTEENINQIVTAGSDVGDSAGCNIDDKCIEGIQGINIPSLTSSSPSNNLVGDIDITSASLLATTEGDGGDNDDLPEDILQQVVDLIKDDKTLQEAVEKQVFGTSVCSDRVMENNIIINQNPPPPLAPISQEALKIEENIQTPSKSIIQLAISNVPTTLLSSPSTTHTISTPTTPTTPTATGHGSNQTFKSSPLMRKEPIQIVRGNGRVITLPPIEAPTTRAKRRAQAQPCPNNSNVGNTSFVSTPILSESSLDSSMYSNSSMTVASNSSAPTMQEKKNAENNNRRRGSKEHVTAAAATPTQRATKSQKTAAKKGGSKSNTNKSKVEIEASAASEEDDDDDPNKLWCICRQPHNNRFMICCDVCEDWFHGTCVSITKAMGLEMEQKGIDWTCPKCTKKQEEKKQPKITEMFSKKTTEDNSDQSEPMLISSTLTPTSITSQTSVPPVVVKKMPANDVIADSVDIVNVAAKKESNLQNLETAPHLKLQSGQIINLKDFSTASTKRATIVQTSTSGTMNLTLGQKKLYVTSGQANLKMSSQPGTPIRTITVVKQLTTPQQHHHHNVKVIKSISPATSQNVTIGTSVTAFPVTSVPSTTTVISSAVSSSTDNSTLCIVCKKIARSNSIYCSDDCIRKHAQNALNSLMQKSQSDAVAVPSPLNKSITEEKAKKKSKGLFEELLSAPDRKPKVERVNVFERKSGRIIAGSSAPTATNLKKWLQDNPTFEVIQPGSIQALDLERKQKLRSQNSTSPTILKSATSSPPPLKMFSSLSSITPNKMDLGVGQSPQFQTKTHKNLTDYLKSTNSNPTSSRPSTPKQLQKYPQQVGIKSDKMSKTADDSKPSVKEKTNTKRQTSIEGSSKSSGNDGEPIRLVVRRTLKEQLLLRIKEETTSSPSMLQEEKEETPKVDNVAKLTEEEIEEFAKATELEMYNYFNRDTGIKYKAKYRSLVFNIKDRKNHTLFAKICEKLIDPKQLVRLSPEEMASQELAQWRKQENKHQLEMIKKSELDLLSCAKNYVLKTHKGEEVIEGKTTDYANVDITIPVEDVVSAINKSTPADAGVLLRKELPTHRSDADTTFLSHSHSLLSDATYSLIDEDKSKVKSCQSKEKDREREKEKDKERDRERERNRGRDREREKRRKSKDRHHEKLRSRKRSRSQSRSRSRERGEKRHKSSHKDEKRDREERIRADKDRAKDRIERDYHSEGNERKSISELKKCITTPPKQLSKKLYEQQKTINPLETYNLIDQILESTKTVEEAANLISDRDKEKEGESQRKTTLTPQNLQLATSSISTSIINSDLVVADAATNLGSTESDQEPTSTVSIPTPPHDPYSRFIACSSPSSFSNDQPYKIISLWTGNVNMVDVTSFKLSLQHIIGNSIGLTKLLPKELDVVGRIGPETVWDYISKIKKSPNKEILLIRLIPANESETVAYKILYEYLDNRNRLGVIKSTSSQIKDFYIYPLGARKNAPNVLQPNEPVDFYDDPNRPDVLIGIIVRVVVSKRTIANSSHSALGGTSSTSTLNKLSIRSDDKDSFTPPGSPKSKKHRPTASSHSVGGIDIDAIIKAPIAAKSQKIAQTPLQLQDNDADEPYSPGGSSDDDLPLLPVKVTNSMDHTQVAEDELKRKMEEINRQIAAQEMEIAGLLTGDSTTYGTAASSTSNVLANISIPSNLSQILASIKTTGKDQCVVPPPPPLIGSLLNSSTSTSAINSSVDAVYNTEMNMASSFENITTGSNKNSSSLLAKLSEAELLSMVPDDVAIAPNKPIRHEEPPPPGV